ncbi:MAG: hypothetical protein IPN43_18020 [Chitinophagaceae bacterium]|nr:hypothetical protein [Chitinophagaceae bacterium]
MNSTTKYAYKSLKFNDLDGNELTFRLKAVTEGYYLYFNCQHLMVELGSEARCFFDYLCERMKSDTNEVIIDSKFKQEFIVQINRITSTKVNPSINSLNKYVSQFKDLGLIIPTTNTRRGYYSVNPKYAYKGTKKDRLILMGNMIKDRIRNKESLRALIDKPEQELGINYDGIGIK